MKSKPSAHPQIAHIEIPHSKMKYPEQTLQKIKYLFWYIYTPIHPYGRDVLLKLGILKHEIRQPFLLGKIDIEKSLADIVHALVKEGYGSHFIAWEDNGETVSLRHVDDFIYQHHIRIFRDGEVRAHLEYTPECHPIWHIKEIGMEDRPNDFLKIIGEYLLPETSAK